MNGSHSAEETIFASALQRAESDRLAYVAEACGDDALLRERILALLRAHVQSGLTKTQSLAAPLKRSEDRIGHYRLLDTIGEGGCGTVYVAEQEEPIRRQVAVKVIKLGMDTKDVIARFEAERQALAMMDHPNIAKIFDAGTTEAGRPYFVMELVRGVPITTFCDERNLPTAARLELFSQLCHAVQHAHQKGIIHRDIKPSNVLVSLHDDRPVLKVIDFGIAKAMAGRLTDQTLYTAVEQFIGTPAYMSPEQAQLSAIDIDTRSDIYSLGVLLYELLTGRTPFDAAELIRAGLDEIRRHIREVDPPRPSTRLSTMKGEALDLAARRRETVPPKLIELVRGDLDWIVMRCLEKERSRRYDTANALADDIQRHLTHEPVVARPPEVGYRFHKFVRRNRTVVVALATVGLALIVGLAAAMLALRRATQAELHSRRLLYASDMNLAQQALKANNLGYTRRLLDRHRPRQLGEVDVRGWEWRYLWQQSRGEALLTLTRRDERGFSLSYSPDGNSLAVGFFDGRIELWDLRTRRLLRVLEGRSGSSAGVVAFSPRANALVRTGTNSGVMMWHNLESNQARELCRLPGVVRDVAFSKDGEQLAVITYRPDASAVHLIDVTSGKIVKTQSVPMSRPIYFGGIRFSPDGQRIYFAKLAAGQPAVECVRLSDWHRLWEADLGRDFGVTALDLSPNGETVVAATGYESVAVHVLDALTGARVTTLTGHHRWVSDLRFASHGKTLVSCSTDQTIRLWRTESWTELARLRGHTEEVSAVAVSPDDAFLASTGKDGTVMLWDANGQRRSERGDFPAGTVGAWSLREAGAVLTLNESGRWTILNPGTLVETPLPFAHSERVYLSAPDVLGEFDGADRLRLIEVHAGGLRPIADVVVGRGFQGFAMSRDRRRLAWGNGTRTIFISDLGAGEHRVEISTGVFGAKPVNFSWDGRFIRVMGKTDRETWEIAGPSVARRDYVLSAESASLAWRVSPASRPNIEDALDRFRPGPGLSVAISADGEKLALGAESGAMGLYQSTRFEALRGQLAAVHGVGFSPDGQRLAASAGGSEAVVIWDLVTNQELLTLPGKGALLTSAAFTSDGNTLFVGALRKGAPWQYWRAPSWAEISAAEGGKYEPKSNPAKNYIGVAIVLSLIGLGLKAATAVSQVREPIRWRPWVRIGGMTGVACVLIGLSLAGKFLHRHFWGVTPTEGGAGLAFAALNFIGAGLVLALHARALGRAITDNTELYTTWWIRIAYDLAFANIIIAEVYFFRGELLPAVVPEGMNRIDFENDRLIKMFSWFFGLWVGISAGYFGARLVTSRRLRGTTRLLVAVGLWLAIDRAGWALFTSIPIFTVGADVFLLHYRWALLAGCLMFAETRTFDEWSSGMVSRLVGSGKNRPTGNAKGPGQFPAPA